MRLLCTYRCLSRKLSSSPLSLDSLLSLSHSTSSVLKRPSDSRSSLSTPSDPQKSSVRSFLYPSCTPNGMQSSGLSVTIDRGRVARRACTIAQRQTSSVCLSASMGGSTKQGYGILGKFRWSSSVAQLNAFPTLLQPTRFTRGTKAAGAASLKRRRDGGSSGASGFQRRVCQGRE